MKKILGIICVLCVSQSVSGTSINASAGYLSVFPGHANCTKSIPIKFDLLLDEKVTVDDPRIKSIVYTTKENLKNTISISYANQNAVPLVNHLANIFLDHGLIVLKPTQIIPDSTDSKIMKYVVIIVNYFTLATKESGVINAESEIAL